MELECLSCGFGFDNIFSGVNLDILSEGCVRVCEMREEPQQLIRIKLLEFSAC